MGDRGNIATIHGKDQQVWIYSHWGGAGLPEALRDALKNAPARHDDPSYMTRIIFECAVPKQQHGAETGFGLSPCITDNRHLILVADMKKKIVFLMKQDELNDAGQVPNDYKPAKQWSFEEFAALPDDQLPPN